MSVPGEAAGAWQSPLRKPDNVFFRIPPSVAEGASAELSR